MRPRIRLQINLEHFVWVNSICLLQDFEEILEHAAHLVQIAKVKQKLFQEDLWNVSDYFSQIWEAIKEMKSIICSPQFILCVNTAVVQSGASMANTCWQQLTLWVCSSHFSKVIDFYFQKVWTVSKEELPKDVSRVCSLLFIWQNHLTALNHMTHATHTGTEMPERHLSA